MEKVRLFGFDFWNVSAEDEAAGMIVDSLRGAIFERDNVNFIITPNAYDIAQYFSTYRSIGQSLSNSAVVLADGIPIVWLSRLFRPSLKKRITGSNLFPALWTKIREHQKKAFFILPNKNIAEKLSAEHPGMLYAIPEFFDEGNDAYIQQFANEHIETIRSFKPDFIFIGITIPKQQKLALALHSLLSGHADFNCFIAILGASFEFYLGLKKRAPVIFQKTGTEWLYRFAQEPKRMWKRYTLGNIRFLVIAVRELALRRRPKKFRK
ncbi:MAG TPA: WecB/TagA/CpsF family glycosyltransferase [Puia sp.]|nr:WecB/TagA/CpsF family glycosyltransferase [Puia sp.]